MPLTFRIALLLALTAIFTPGQIRYEEILKSPNDHWLSYSGDYAGQRHSPLRQIDLSTVGNLVPKWTYLVEGARTLETTPLVFDGVMYITGINEVQALDAASGRRIWRYRDEQAVRQARNRGVALLGDAVFFVTNDARLVAVHRKTGALLWRKAFALSSERYGASLAPLALKDRIIVGVSGGEQGTRGYVAALSATDGTELWRFWTVPARGEPGSETWEGTAMQWGGAATWLTGTYDPNLNLIYWPTGNPWPDFSGIERRGDNLYSDSVVALDATTGKLKWHFQFTPHDTHDWDAQAIPVLIDTDFRGRPRKLLVQANRNGFFYVLDRTSGEFLLGKPFIDRLTWATGVDDKGRPVLVPGMNPTPAGKTVCPSLRGASNWPSPTYSPETKLIYVPTLEQCSIYMTSEKKPELMLGYAGGGSDLIPSDPGKFFLRALDPRTGERRWEYPMTGPATTWAGAVSTAGGLVFFGDDDGHLVALNAKTGQHLWHYQMGDRIIASPVTFMADGKQYVTIATQTNIFTFGLFEPAKPVPLVKPLSAAPIMPDQLDALR